MSSPDTTFQRPPSRVPPLERPVVIEARDVQKTFRIPQHRVDSLKERATHPFRRIEYRELRALRDISFDVHEGEFFGIVGRNGSGKSTLLKIMASIYGLSGGRIRMAGRLAPFIELGVGFNPDLTARENVVLNGVMMGLSRREAATKLDAVLDFAELGDFVELKLKNYSSGMMVRLAFAVMVQADADIMLIDEVLAVGDASFAQKCVDVFYERRQAGKTVVLVTHDMSTVQAFCDRAMVLHDGELRYLGEPEEAALRYYRLNFGGVETAERPRDESGVIPDVNARLVETWLEDEQGERVDNVEQGEPLRLRLVVEALRDLNRPVLGFHVMTAEGTGVFGFNHQVTEDVVHAGQRIRVSSRVENPLLPGRYFVTVWVARDRHHGDVALQVLRLVDFVVYGTQHGPGVVSTSADVQAVVEP
jgi:ABC-2 type transport system ATP-binding protein